MELSFGRSNNQDVIVDAQKLVTGRTCVIAQSGAGKSWGIAVICEQLLQMNIGFCIIDTEGEYASLKDQFNITWIGSDKQCDYDIEQITEVELSEIVKDSMYERHAFIFDVSEVDMREHVISMTRTLYSVASKIRQPFLLIVEEADKFIPQSGISIQEIEEISRRGRKRGLGLLIATQRPSLVTKNVLSQCDSQIIGKLSIENDLKSVRLFFSSTKEVSELTRLKPGDFFIMGNLSHDKRKMKFHSRICEHRGVTPLLSDKPVERNFIIDDVTPFKIKVKPSILYEAVPLLIQREQALMIAMGQKKRYIPFMQSEEFLTTVDLVYRPFHNVNVKYIHKRIVNSVKSITFTIDGLTGSIIKPKRNGFGISKSLIGLFGLDTDEVRIISSLANGGSSIDEIVALTRISKKDVGKILGKLMNKKLVIMNMTGSGVMLYVSLLEYEPPSIQRLNISYQPFVNCDEDLINVKRLETKIDEKNLNNIIKGIEPTAEIIKMTTYYYPTYLAQYMSEHNERSIDIDGCSGNTIVFPHTLSITRAKKKK